MPDQDEKLHDDGCPQAIYVAPCLVVMNAHPIKYARSIST